MNNPEILSIDITYRCNLKCIMCEVSNIINKKDDELNTSEIINFINNVLNKYSIKSVRFLGGEPLLRKDLETIISGISSRVHTKIITNGTLITEERAKRIVESKTSLVSFSIDGPEHIHDMFRGIGSFKQAISGLDNLNKAKKEMGYNLPEIEIIPCVSKANVNEMDSMMEIAKNYNAKLVLVNFLMEMLNTPKDTIDGEEITTVRATDPLNLILNAKEKADYLQKYFSKENTSDSFISNAKQKFSAFINKKIVDQLEENYFDCDRARRMMIVDPWGDLFPCEFLYGYKYGNVKEGAAVWNSAKRKEIRKKIINGDLNMCNDCNKKNLKRGIRVVTKDIKSLSKFIYRAIKV
jgi:radical SAM protein with 4Fe4S-binding SPASM domain